MGQRWDIGRRGKVRQVHVHSSIRLEGVYNRYRGVIDNIGTYRDLHGVVPAYDRDAEIDESH